MCFSFFVVVVVVFFVPFVYAECHRDDCPFSSTYMCSSTDMLMNYYEQMMNANHFTGEQWAATALLIADTVLSRIEHRDPFDETNIAPLLRLVLDNNVDPGNAGRASLSLSSVLCGNPEGPCQDNSSVQLVQYKNKLIDVYVDWIIQALDNYVWSFMLANPYKTPGSDPGLLSVLPEFIAKTLGGRRHWLSYHWRGCFGSARAATLKYPYEICNKISETREICSSGDAAVSILHCSRICHSYEMHFVYCICQPVSQELN